VTDTTDALALLRKINDTAAFNRWCGFEVQRAAVGEADLAMPWKPELGQYTGFLHAGVVGALIDTACGYAAATQLGPRLLASHFAVNCIRPAVGERFVAKAKVLRGGKQQVFTHCELYAHDKGQEKLVATGETLLCVVAG
jgi:uncharacterized protein (TIGR00369 family)